MNEAVAVAGVAIQQAPPPMAMTGIVSVVQPDPGSPEQQSRDALSDPQAITGCASPSKLVHSRTIDSRRRIMLSIIGCPLSNLPA